MIVPCAKLSSAYLELGIEAFEPRNTGTQKMAVVLNNCRGPLEALPCFNRERFDLFVAVATTPSRVGPVESFTDLCNEVSKIYKETEKCLTSISCLPLRSKGPDPWLPRVYDYPLSFERRYKAVRPSLKLLQRVRDLLRRAKTARRSDEFVKKVKDQLRKVEKYIALCQRLRALDTRLLKKLAEDTTVSILQQQNATNHRHYPDLNTLLEYHAIVTAPRSPGLITTPTNWLRNILCQYAEFRAFAPEGDRRALLDMIVGWLREHEDRFDTADTPFENTESAAYPLRPHMWVTVIGPPELVLRRQLQHILNVARSPADDHGPAPAAPEFNPVYIQEGVVALLEHDLLARHALTLRVAA